MDHTTPTTLPREHEPRKPYNLRSQGIAALAHLANADTFALMADMMPEEPYEPKS
jgi:hypothetical protein